MKKSRFSEQQIINILKEADAGVKVQGRMRTWNCSFFGPGSIQTGFCPRTRTNPVGQCLGQKLFQQNKDDNF